MNPFNFRSYLPLLKKQSVLKLLEIASSGQVTDPLVILSMGKAITQASNVLRLGLNQIALFHKKDGHWYVSKISVFNNSYAVDTFDIKGKFVLAKDLPQEKTDLFTYRLRNEMIEICRGMAAIARNGQATPASLLKAISHLDD